MYEKVKNMDFFGTIVGLRYKGAWRYKTFLGGLFSMTLLVFSLATIIYFSIKFISRQEIKMTFENIKYWNPPLINLTENFSFAVSMQYGNQNLIRPEVIDISFEYVQFNQTSNVLSTIPLSSIPCARQMFLGAEEQFDNLGIKNGTCIDTSKLSIQGSIINTFYSFIRVKFIMCSNHSYCLSLTDISNILASVKPVANIYYLDSTFQPKIADRFVLKFINNVDVNLTFNNAKRPMYTFLKISFKFNKDG